jgi:hypothetical protein
VANLGKEQREALAEKRILRALSALTIANQRTLEQKISDAGPGDQRCDPHIITTVRNRLIEQGVIGEITTGGAPWYFASNTSPSTRDERLETLLAIYRPYREISDRIGDALEIATYRAFCQSPKADFFGRFKNLDEHDDSKRYKKEGPLQHIGGRVLAGNQSLDFLLETSDAGPLGIECKNVRHWMYPHVDEIRELLVKCVALDAVPVLIARRIHFSTFAVYSKCGVIVHQTYNPLLPESDAALAGKLRDKTLLGYHDIRLGNQPDARLVKFITVNLPKVAAEARAKFRDYQDLIQAYADGSKEYEEFAGRVLRRWRGEDEDGVSDDVDVPPEWPDY